VYSSLPKTCQRLSKGFFDVPQACKILLADQGLATGFWPSKGFPKAYKFEMFAKTKGLPDAYPRRTNLKVSPKTYHRLSTGCLALATGSKGLPKAFGLPKGCHRLNKSLPI
jgi:hypothetical protein